MMKPKRRRERKIRGQDAQRYTSRETMVSSSIGCTNKRKSSRIPTLIQLFSILLPMLLPMGGSKLKITSIRSIGWRARSVYLHLCLTINYIISWFYTCKVRNGTWVWGLVIWNNRGLFLIWRQFSLFFNHKNCIVFVTSQRRGRSTHISNSTTWRESTIIMDIMSSAPIITRLDRYR